MDTLLVFAFLILVVFGGSVKLFSKIRTASPFSYIFYSGTFYLLFGLLLGQNGFQLVSNEILEHLSPIFHFSLGWVGFIFGFQFELRFLKKIPFFKYLAFVIAYLIKFLSIFLFTFYTLNLFFGKFVGNNQLLFGAAVVLTFLIAESSPSFVAWSSKLFKEKFTELKLCAFIATMNNLIPIFLTGIIFSVYGFSQSSGAIELNSGIYMLSHLLVQLVAAVFFGVSIYFLQKKLEDRLEVSVVLFGSIFLISGISFMYDLSPLFIAMISGAIFANLTKKHLFILKIINPTEKPVYLFFLLVLALKEAYFSVLMVVFVLLMLFVKFISTYVAFKYVNRLKPEMVSIPPFFSIILLPVSSIGPAILLDLSITYPTAYVTVLAGIFIMTLLIAEIISPIVINIKQKAGKDD